MQFALWKAFDAVASITEQHAAGAVAIHQHGDQRFTCFQLAFTVAVRHLQQGGNIFFAHQRIQTIEFFTAEHVIGQQQAHRISDRTEVFLLCYKLLKIVEAVGIEQTQARKVAFHAELFRRGGQQQHGRDLLGQLFNHLIFTARFAFAPRQMMRFIDHQQIPFRIGQLLKTLFVATYKVERTDDHLLGIKRVSAVEARFGVTVVVKQRETQVKATQHFHQPLMLQRFRHHDQHAFGAARQILLLNDHAGFNGFAQAHFICQQHARCVATANIVCDMQLMRNQIGAHATQAAGRQAILLAVIFTGAKTQGKTIHTIELAGKQAILRLAEHQLTVEHHFTQHDAGFCRVETRADIADDLILFEDFFNFQLPAFMAGDGITRIKHDTGHGRIISGIQAVFTGCGEEQGHHSGIHSHHGSQSKFAFRIADPALTKFKRHKLVARFSS